MLHSQKPGNISNPSQKFMLSLIQINPHTTDMPHKMSYNTQSSHLHTPHFKLILIINN